jgi:hypothetical protein
MRKKWLYGVIMAGVLTAVACSDDEVAAPEDPVVPALPPASSPEFDLGISDTARGAGQIHGR